MSIPVSLRLWCIAAMAPALTESSSQSRVQLPGSPPPVVLENPLSGSGNSSKNLNSIDLVSVKTKLSRSFSSELQNTARGLLKPIQGNIDAPSAFLSEKIQKSLQDLGLPPNFPDILKQLTTVQSVVKLDVNSTTDNHRVRDKTMNRPSSGNGTDQHLLKQNTLVKDKAVNGHSSKHNDLARRLSYARTALKAPEPQNGALDLSKSSKMCLITDSTVAPQTLSRPSTSQEQRQTTLQPIHFVQLNPTESLETNVQNEAKPVDLKDVTRKEYLLERRSQFLLRRLRRLEGKHLESQVKLQLKAFIDFQHHNLQSAASKAIRPFGDIPNTLFNSGDVKNLSTSNLVTLVRKLQASQPKHAFESNNKKTDAKKSVLVMDQSVSSESDRKSGHLRRNLRHWSDVVDSDVTESSSGGESCEEWEDCPLMSDKKVPTPL